MSAPTDRITPGERLRATTQARIGLGRHGAGMPTRALIDFQMAHAKARDAVLAPLPLLDLPEPVITAASRAPDRATYLQRPDLGRRLDAASAATLANAAADFDAVLIAADGLSATALAAHGAPLIAEVRARLRDWRLAPVVVARQARVALSDEIGALLGARLALILIGERPGLSAPDSLGAYLTWAPRIGRDDSERNCVSNIRPPHGLTYGDAADRICWLMREARRRALSGVALKDGFDPVAPALAAPDA